MNYTHCIGFNHCLSTIGTFLAQGAFATILIVMWYMLQNMYEKALEIYIQLSRPDVFEFITEHALLRHLSGKFTALFVLDEERALKLLCSNAEEASPTLVVQEIQAVMVKSRDKGNEKKAAEWRTILYKYCDKLTSESMASTPDEVHVLLVRYEFRSCLESGFSSFVFAVISAEVFDGVLLFEIVV